MRIHFRGDDEMKIMRLDTEQFCPKRHLDHYLDRECCDIQDNIFAFLNLFDDDIRQRIPVHLKTPRGELLLQTARAIIESTQSLYIIVIRGRQTPPSAQGDDNWQLEMSSWCPYLATPYECLSIEPQDEPSFLAERSVVSFLADHSLRARGFAIGRISRTISPNTAPKIGATTWWDEYGIIREWKYYEKCLYLGLSGVPDDVHMTHASIKATTRTLLAGRGGSSSEISLIDHFLKCRAVGWGPIVTALREIWNNKNYRLVCSFRLSRVAVRAKDSSKMAPTAWINRIALVPRTVRRGDAICAILGCPVAVVLRRRGKRYQVLGEAYVDTSAMGPFNVVVGLRDFILE